MSPHDRRHGRLANAPRRVRDDGLGRRLKPHLRRFTPASRKNPTPSVPGFLCPGRIEWRVHRLMIPHGRHLPSLTVLAVSLGLHFVIWRWCDDGGQGEVVDSPQVAGDARHGHPGGSAGGGVQPSVMRVIHALPPGRWISWYAGCPGWALALALALRGGLALAQGSGFRRAPPPTPEGGGSGCRVGPRWWPAAWGRSSRARGSRPGR